LLATSPASLSTQAIEIDLGQENEPAQGVEPCLVLSSLAPAQDQGDVADAGVLANPAEPALPSTEMLARVQDQVGSALEAPLESEGSSLQFQDESSCLIAVDQQDAIPSPEDSSIEARAPPAQGVLELSGMSLVDPDLGQLAVGQSTSSSSTLELFATSPALFVENQGQWADTSVRYVHDGSSMDVAVTDSGVWFQATRGDLNQGEDSAGPVASEHDPLQTTDTNVQMLQFSATFVGADLVQPVGLELSESLFNYYVG
ncbi:unnamed protein product, partial [marine sediment metagenome]